MKTTRKQLLEAVERLEDADIRELLEITLSLRKGNGGADVLSRLAQDPAFRVPDEPRGKLIPIRPMRSRGKPASQVLIEDRR